MSTDLPAVRDLDGITQRAADPAEYLVTCCERAKTWLTAALESGDIGIDQIVEVKSQAEAIRVYTVQKNLGRDAELAAQEIVRRAERGIGLAIRKGQQDGTIARPGVSVTTSNALGERIFKPSEFVPRHDLRSDIGNGAYGIYAMTDGVSDEQFEQAIDEAKAEKNLSRANVVRKAKGTPPPEPRSEWHHKRRRIDHYRVLAETEATLDGLAAGLRLIDIDAIPEVERPEWADRLRQALRPITAFIREVST